MQANAARVSTRRLRDGHLGRSPLLEKVLLASDRLFPLVARYLDTHRHRCSRLMASTAILRSRDKQVILVGR